MCRQPLAHGLQRGSLKLESHLLSSLGLQKGQIMDGEGFLGMVFGFSLLGNKWGFSVFCGRAKPGTGKSPVPPNCAIPS